jgi:hypothetical protein
MNRQRPGERLSMQRVEDSRHTLTPDHKIAPTLGLLLIGVTCWQDAQGQPATTRVSPTHHQRLRRTHHPHPAVALSGVVRCQPPPIDSRPPTSPSPPPRLACAPPPPRRPPAFMIRTEDGINRTVGESQSLLRPLS